ncbi:hypothetical protein KXX32_008817 [Aspergillus fumigatus]|nr:hypothetical protein KXX32_008817 [Aspergillus fumigatus]
MDRPTRIIDPEGEVIIVLSNPNAPFVQLSEDMITEDVVEESTGTLSENEKRMKKDKEMVSSHWSDDFIPPQPPEQPIEELVAEEPASEWSTSRWIVAEEAAFEEPAVEETAVEESAVEEHAAEEQAA